MTDEIKGGVEENVVPDDLHKMSLEAQAFAKALQNLYDEDDGTAIDALDHMKANLLQLQKILGEAREGKLSLSTEQLKVARTKLDSERKRLDAIVDVVNGVNEILDITTQIAQIAAGLMV